MPDVGSERNVLNQNMTGIREGSQPFPLPQYLQIYPTYHCNQNCTFCFNSHARPLKDMLFDRALRLIDSMIQHGTRELDIMGGEPFLLGWMPDFIRKATAKDIMLNISTNGSCYEPLKRLAQIDPERLNVGVSLEGSTAEKHNRLTRSQNYEKAVRSIQMLVSMGFNPIVKTVVNRFTMDDVPDIVCLLRELGVRRYYLIHMDLFSADRPSDKGSLSFLEFLSFYQKAVSQHADVEIHKVNASCFDRQSLPPGIRCAGGVRKLSIMPDGSVYPCNLFQHFPEFNIGNVYTDGFLDIWNNPKLAYFRRCNGNICSLSDCVNHASCTGGCPAHGYFHSKSMNMPDIRCLINRLGVDSYT